MAEKKAISVGNSQSTEARSAQSSLAAPSVGAQSVLQDGMSFTPLDYNSDQVVQPFPRSPKLQKKIAKAAQPSQVMMRRCSEAVQRYISVSLLLSSLKAQSATPVRFTRS